jgi:hypothetical protein
MTDTFKMADWNDDQFARFERVAAVFEHYGYSVMSEPMVGQFDIWLSGLADEAKALEERAEFYRRTYGFRGTSKRLLDALHTVPETFNAAVI